MKPNAETHGGVQRPKVGLSIEKPEPQDTFIIGRRNRFDKPCGAGSVVPERGSERFAVFLFGFVDVRNMQGATADFPDCPKIAAGDLGFFWPAITGKGYGIINRISDLLVPNHPYQAIIFQA